MRCENCGLELAEENFTYSEISICRDCSAQIQLQNHLKNSMGIGSNNTPLDIEPQILYEAILGEKNRNYYLMKFKIFDQQGTGLKASWNWSALLAGGVWALYRKMYGWFFALWGVAFFSNIFEKTGSPGLSAIIFLVPGIAFSIYANSFYHNSVKKKIAIAQVIFKEEPKLLEYLRCKGGVHSWIIWVFVGMLVIGILAAILIPMFARL